MSLAPGGRRGLSALDTADVLLVLILCLGGARLLGLFFAPALSGDITAGEDPVPPNMALILFLLLLQNLLIFWAVYWVAVKGRGVSWEALGARLPLGRWLKRSILSAVIALPVVGIINALVNALAGVVLKNPQFEVVAGGGFTWSGFLGSLLVLSFVAPPVEELLFRGLIYGWMRERWGMYTAFVGSALIFAVLHGVIWLIPAVFALGLLLAWLYEESGSLLVPAVTHGVFNSVTTIILYASLAFGVVQPG